MYYKCICAGADFAPPPLPPASLVIWKALLAGGIAGIVSRTATAPLEKLKMMAQVIVVMISISVMPSVPYLLANHYLKLPQKTAHF